MQIRLGYELIYQCVQATPMLLTLRVHHTRAADLLKPDAMTTDPRLPLRTYRDSFGNSCTRLHAAPGRIRIGTDTIIRDRGLPDPVVADAEQQSIESLADEALVYLLPSRYCDTDNLSQAAWSLFGHAPLGWARVQTVCDFVHRHLEFGYAYARGTRTASDAYNERRGVCRDFAHLAITLCRCLNIPARYCTGYLGDIGVPPADSPMDFSAWFEAFLGGRWHTFDARHNEPRIGRVLIAHGRDAADVAISMTFGQCWLEGFRVWTDEIKLS
jgi:transglutaminase-like putative cysteine protease